MQDLYGKLMGHLCNAADGVRALVLPCPHGRRQRSSSACCPDQCIGATTLDEYRKHIEKDPALERFFQPVKVPDPTVDESVHILRGLCERYELHHKLTYTHEALVAAAQLSYQYIRFALHLTYNYFG